MILSGIVSACVVGVGSCDDERRDQTATAGRPATWKTGDEVLVPGRPARHCTAQQHNQLRIWDLIKTNKEGREFLLDKQKILILFLILQCEWLFIPEEGHRCQ